MTKSLIDPSVYAELSNAMGADFAAELVTTFLDDAPNMLADLRQAVAAQDADSYRRAAHSIKSNADVFGATALADQARTMEMTGLSDSAAMADQLETTFTETAAVLKGLVDE